MSNMFGGCSERNIVKINNISINIIKELSYNI